MSGKSLGLIETVGMSAAVEAADAAMKSANVSLVGYELLMLLHGLQRFISDIHTGCAD